jgi:hypothetical protein
VLYEITEEAVMRIGTPGEAGYRWHGGIMR